LGKRRNDFLFGGGATLGVEKGKKPLKTIFVKLVERNAVARRKESL